MSGLLALLTLRHQWCICLESVKKLVKFLFLVYLFFTVSWSQVYLNDDHLSVILCCCSFGCSLFCVFYRVVGRGSLGSVCQCREVVSHQDTYRDDPFQGFRKSSGSHTHIAWRVSAYGALSSWLLICYWLGRCCDKEFLVHSVLSFRGCNLWLPGRSRWQLPLSSLVRLAHYSKLCGAYKWDSVHLSRDPKQSWNALIHAVRGLPQVSCLPWGLELRLSHSPAHRGPHSLGMLHGSLMWWWLCSLRLQCKETQLLWYSTSCRTRTLCTPRDYPILSCK